MNYLADTHIAIWAIDGSRRLPPRARDLMETPEAGWRLSVVSVWEVLLKHRTRPENLPIDPFLFARDCAAAGFELLNLQAAHVFEAASLPTEGVHKDPIDRMLLAQARAEGLVLVTHDRVFKAYEDPHVMLV